jgi:hypothetical protein
MQENMQSALEATRKNWLRLGDMQFFNSGGTDPAPGTDPGQGAAPEGGTTDPDPGQAPSGNTGNPPTNPEPPAQDPPSGSSKTLTLTQEEFDAKIAERLRRDRETKNYEDLAAKANKWEEFERNQKSDFENLQTDFESLQQNYNTAQQQLDQMKVDSLKTEVLTKLELPLDLKDRVKGSTLEEITADAESLKQFVGTKQTQKPPVGGGSNPSSGGSSGGKIFTRAELDTMGPGEINANWDTIQDQLSRGLIR